MGVLAANGIGLKDFWGSLLANRSGIGSITSFDASKLPYRIAGEVKGFDPMATLGRELKPRRMGRFSQFAVAAGFMARDDAGLTDDDIRRLRQFPVVMGVSTSDMEQAAKKPNPFRAVSGIPHAAASTLGYALHPQPELITLSDGCSSGLEAVMHAARLVESGIVDLVFAGATDASLTPLTIEVLVRCGACVPSELAPEKVSRPFDQKRQGGVAAEGAGIIVLEREESAAARGVTPYAEILGSASASDPRETPEGSGMKTTMELALANAGCSPSSVDYVNAHAPSDQHMDAIETQAIKDVLRERAYEIPVSSIKGATGCPMAAGGIHQVIATALSLKHRTIPPTTNFEQGDEACDLDYVPHLPRRADLRTALLNTHGFGRGNASMIMSKVS